MGSILSEFVNGLVAAGGSLSLQHDSSLIYISKISGLTVTFPQATGATEPVTLSVAFKGDLIVDATVRFDIGNNFTVSSSSTASQIDRFVTFLTEDAKDADGNVTIDVTRDQTPSGLDLEADGPVFTAGPRTIAVDENGTLPATHSPLPIRLAQRRH